MKISEAVRDFKWKLIKGALELNDGDISKTARFLGTSRNNLIRWTKALDLFGYATELRSQRIESYRRRRRGLWYRGVRIALACATCVYAARTMI